MTRHFHSAQGRIRAGRTPAAHGNRAVVQEHAALGKHKSTVSVPSVAPPALIRQGGTAVRHD